LPTSAQTRIGDLRDHITFIFRGEPVALRGFPPTRTLLEWLREDRRATGTKEGCNEGDCGACTVVLARVEHGRLVHRPVNACIALLGQADGAELITIEDLADSGLADSGLAESGRLHPIQEAMVVHHGSQCGFCTPGIVMSLFAMGKEGGAATRPRIEDQLAGNLCRCTGYRPIVDAALASHGAPDRFDAMEPARIARLEALEDKEGACVAPSPSWRSSEGETFFAIPRTLAEALALYAAHPDATILAGATDVGLWITKQFRPVAKFIWLGRIAELARIDDADNRLTIGAGVSHEAAMPYLAAISPDLGELGRRFGSKQVRAQGTVGGNIANGSPIGDWAPAFIALGAQVELASATPIPPPCGEGGPAQPGREVVAPGSPVSLARPPPDPPLRVGPPSPSNTGLPVLDEQGVQMRQASSGGRGMKARTLPLESFFIAYGRQDRAPGEIVSALAIPKLAEGEHFRCLKIAKRFDEDISAVMGAFKLTVEDGRIAAARIAFGGMAATPRRAPLVEAALVGVPLTDRAAWGEALAAIEADYQPIDDLRASARYRREAAKALLLKALIEIGGGGGTRIRSPRATEASHAA